MKMQPVPFDIQTTNQRNFKPYLINSGTTRSGGNTMNTFKSSAAQFEGTKT